MESPTSPDYIIKQRTRVLMPSEWLKLRKAMITPETQSLIDEKVIEHDFKHADYLQRYPIICDMLLQTGMRLVEARALERSWYRAPRRVIVIPEGACKKVRCTFQGRTVMLSLPGCDAVDRYLQSGLQIPEDDTTIRDALRRYAVKAGIGIDGITGKMFRKTLASWLMACFPEQQMYVSASMGHDLTTLQKHYLGLGFPRHEVELMREKFLPGWGLRL